MASEVKKEIELEIAYVLFIDIVGYSKLLINEQRRILELLNQIVRKFGSKGSGMKHAVSFYADVVSLIGNGVSDIIPNLTANSAYSYLQPGEKPYDGCTNE